jgi:hypothetical protein
MEKCKRIIIILFLFILTGCGDEKLYSPDCINFDFNPFSKSCEDWANHIKNYFNYDSLIGYWSVKDYYIAILIKNDVLDICSVSKEFIEYRKTWPMVDITDNNDNYITDSDRLMAEIKKDATLGRKIHCYEKRLELVVNRLYYKKEYFKQNVVVRIKIVKTGTSIKEAKNIEPNIRTTVLLK